MRTLIYEPNGYATAGGVTDEIMTLSGLEDVAPELKPTRTDTLAVESVIARAPELLILSGERATPNSRADLVQHHPALAAVKEPCRVDEAHAAALSRPLVARRRRDVHRAWRGSEGTVSQLFNQTCHGPRMRATQVTLALPAEERCSERTWRHCAEPSWVARIRGP